MSCTLCCNQLQTLNTVCRPRKWQCSTAVNIDAQKCSLTSQGDNGLGKEAEITVDSSASSLNLSSTTLEMWMQIRSRAQDQLINVWQKMTAIFFVLKFYSTRRKIVNKSRKRKFINGTCFFCFERRSTCFEEFRDCFSFRDCLSAIFMSANDSCLEAYWNKQPEYDRSC